MKCVKILKYKFTVEGHENHKLNQIRCRLSPLGRDEIQQVSFIQHKNMRNFVMNSDGWPTERELAVNGQ